MYCILKKILKNLKLLYEKKNKIAKTKIKFKNFNFRIKILNKSEIFEQLVVRFNITIVFLNINSATKIRYLKWIIFAKLQYKITNLIDIKNNYYAFIKSVRNINNWVKNISLDNVNKIKNKFKLKISRDIVEYIFKIYRKKIFLDIITKIASYLITRFLAYIC